MKLLNIHTLSLSILFISGILVYPLYLISPKDIFGSVYFQIFTLSTISTLALSIVLFNSKNLLFRLKSNSELLISIFVILIISVIHFFYFTIYSFENFGFSVIWISIPLVVFIYTKQFKKLAPVYFFIFWIIDLIHTYNQTGEKVGVCGNRNWHAIFLVSMIIMSFFILKIAFNYKNIKGSKTVEKFLKFNAVLIFTALYFYSLYIIYLCDSRGALLGAAICLFVYSIFSLNSKLFKGKEFQHFNKKYFLYFILSIIIIFSVIFLYALKNNIIGKNISSFENKVLLQKNETYNEIEDAVNRDVRAPLWIGTLNLILDNPLIGVGAERFETTFASYRPISYFQKDMSATRTNHPHNIILYILACYGLPGFVFWAALFIYPIFFCFYKYRNLSFFEKCSLFAYLALFIHACFDLIFYVWPTLFIALLLLGVLWNKTWNNNAEEKIQNYGLKLQIIFSFTAVCLLFATFYNVYNDSVGTYNIFKGSYYEARGNSDLALKYYDKALKYIKADKFIYKAGLIAFNSLNNPSLALKYFSYCNFVPTQNYAHNNGFIALCLIQKGDIKAAIPYLIKEVINYPLSTGAWYRLSFAQKSIGLDKPAKFSYDNMLNTLAYKNLPKKALKYVLENPEYDKHPNKIPKHLLD